MALAHITTGEEAKKPLFLHTTNMLQKAQAQCINEFHQSNIFKDTMVRHNPIIKAIIYRWTDTFITLQENHRSVKFVTAMSNEAIPGISKNHAVTKVDQKVSLPILNT